MKKILSVVLAVSLVFIMCLPAFAGASIDALEGNTKTIAEIVDSKLSDTNKAANDAQRSQITGAVVSGLNMDDFKDMSEADILAAVRQAVDAVTADGKSINPNDAQTLASDIAVGINKKANPSDVTNPTVTPDEKTPDTDDSSNTDENSVVDTVKGLPYNTIKQIIVTLVNNKAITKDQAKDVAKTLNSMKVLTDSQRKDLEKSIESGEAGNGIFQDLFNGYTPLDLSQLFRGFGDAIGTITSGLANLLRGGSKLINKGGNSTDFENVTTGDHSFAYVGIAAAIAGAGLLLTRKKVKKEEK